MKPLVMKFGGASVATPEQFGKIAEIVLKKSLTHPKIVVVVSAMGDTTDELIALAKKVHPNPPKRELDMLVSIGERISISLLAMALEKKGRKAISFTGSQSGIITTNDHTEAKIIDVKPYRILSHLDEGRIIIVAGFQGVSSQRDITTLGRGGSDTSAVALCVALGGKRVEFYKDVPGIFSEDPKKNPKGELFSSLLYKEALDLMDRMEVKVLSPRCITLAAKNGVILHVLPFEGEAVGTTIGEPLEVSTPCYEVEESLDFS